MSRDETLLNKAILLESRLNKLEINHKNLHNDIKEIKKNLRWLIGLIFSLTSAIIGSLIKGIM